MLTQIDHIVVVVEELEQAAAGFREAGFTVTPGGEHAGGETHNALVPFADGTFIELLAFIENTPDRHHYFSQRHRLGGGLAEFSMLSSDIERDIRTIAGRGLTYPMPTRLARVRPDGVRLEWSMSLPGLLHQGRGLPFLIQDITNRHLRVPCGKAETRHANGAIGVAGVTVVVGNLDDAQNDYRAILGVPPNRAALDGAGRGLLRIPLPENADQWIALMQTFPRSTPEAWFKRFGEGPYAVHLRREAGTELTPGEGTLLEPRAVGGARFYLQDASLERA